MIRGLALALTVVTGATGLVYEVVWQKYLATLLGSHAEATAAVLGLFLAGLAIGYGLFGAVSRRIVASAARRGQPPRILLTYGAVEAAIGVYALLFPALFVVARRLSLALPAGSPAVSFAGDVVLAALLLLPPTILMGGTIPLLTQGLARSLADATRFHAWVYAFNTAGAFLGSLAAGFVLLPWLGLRTVMLAMGLVNVGAGAVFAALGRRGAEVAAAAPEGTAQARPAGFAAWLAIALLCGFAMMVIQTAANRLAGLTFGSSPYTFSMVVALFVLSIAAGSALVSALSRIPSWLLLADLGLLFGWFAAVHLVLEDAPFWGHVTRLMFGNSRLAFYPYSAAALLLMLVTAGPGVLLSGATLPLLFHQLKQRHGELGALAGSLYGWNTVGSLFGALIGGHLLLIWLDLDAVYRVALGALGLAFALALISTGTRRLLVAGALAASLVALAVLPPWDPLLLSVGLFRSRSQLPVEDEVYTPASVRAFAAKDRLVLFYDDDPIASISVHEFVLNGARQRAILNNGKSDGSTVGDYETQALLGLLPAALLDRLESAFVVGFGTGVTVGELAALDAMREVVVAEISSGVLDASPFFASVNLDPLASPKVRVIRSDAYRALLREERRFDLVISEPSNPWMAGVEMLFSREFLEAGKSRVAPGGAYVQWFQTYETDEETLALVLRTFTSVFPETTVWYGLGSDLLLIGFPEPHPPFEVAALSQRIQRPDLAAGLARSDITSVEELAAHELIPLGVLHATHLPGPLHTLFHPRLTYRAARAFFTGSFGFLPPTAFGRAGEIGANSSLVRRLARRDGGTLSDASYAKLVEEGCSHRGDICTAMLADWQRTRPDSPLLGKWRGRPLKTRLEEQIDAADVETLATLFAGRPLPTAGPVSPELAERATLLVRRYRLHATPFDVRVLRGLWERCQAPRGSDACARGRAQAEALLSGDAAS